jgi:hypothetical protein
MSVELPASVELPVSVGLPASVELLATSVESVELLLSVVFELVEFELASSSEV